MSGVHADLVALCLCMPPIVFGMYTDIHARRISNRLNLLLLVAGLAVGFARQGVTGVGQSAAGAVVGLAILLPFYAIGALGAGDAKFMAGMGAWLGVGGAWHALCVGAVLAGFVGLVQILRSEDRALLAGNLMLIRNKILSGRLLDPNFAGYAQLNQGRVSMPYGAFLGIGALAILTGRSFGLHI